MKLNQFRHLLVIAVLILLPTGPVSGQSFYDPEDADMIWTKEYGDRLVKELKTAREEIYVLQYLIMGRGYVPDVQNILNTLKTKANNGVEVTIIADGSREGEYGNPINSMLHTYFETAPVDVTVLSPDQVMHSKVVIIDRKKSFIGSQNWSRDGLSENVELAVYVNDASFSSDLRDQLEQSLKDRLEKSVLQPGEKSLNNVTKKELMTLPIIGRHFAERIINYRRKKGRIDVVEELDNIGGIGKERMKILVDYFGEDARARFKKSEESPEGTP